MKDIEGTSQVLDSEDDKYKKAGLLVMDSPRRQEGVRSRMKKGSCSTRTGTVQECWQESDRDGDQYDFGCMACTAEDT